MTFSDITRIQSNFPSQTLKPFHTYTEITREETLKINICVAHAHYRNLENPGTYGEKLYIVLTANGLPNIVIPDYPN